MTFSKKHALEDLPMDCANKQFIRVDEYILKGYAQTTTQTTTLADCVASCVREKEFECRVRFVLLFYFCTIEIRANIVN